MSSDRRYIFSKHPRPRPPDAHPDSPVEPEPYVASDGLVVAVNLAIYLRRPLLLEGEAGCGKTRLARAVAYQLGLPYYAWPVRSTSRAQEGLYTYDAVLRLHDVQTHRVESQTDAHASRRDGRDPSEPRHYRKFGALGKAFQLRDCPAVVLIDEIDKADIDFPNDLLTVLDRPWQFPIPETNEMIAAEPDCLPILFITSNKEKGNLPAPFLRRCLYYFVEFPGDLDTLQKIVAAHYQHREIEPPPEDLRDRAIQRFLRTRGKGDLYKKPGTSEFLDWLEALQSFGDKPYPAEALTKDEDTLPYPELLFKLRADWQRYRKAT